jgi:ligand-binding sensor domain-containing protein/signal transduction histidine kinase
MATCLAVPSIGSSAPGKNPIIRSWGTEAGLPQITVNSIVQTRDGYLWVATQDGLARFDGVRFTVFGLADGLSTVEISTLYEDRNGTLWVGTVGRGLNRFVEGRFEAVRRPGDELGDELTAGTITSFAEDGQGRLWIASTTGLRLFEAGHFVEENVVKQLARTMVRRLLFDKEGRMWIASYQGLFLYEHGQLTPQPGPPINPQVNAYCLLEDRQGRLWASVGNGRLLCLENKSWRVYTESEGVSFAYTTSLAEDAEGTIWAGSLDDGLYRLEQGHFIAMRRAQGLSSDDIRCLQIGREGDLWVGTRTGGLNCLSHRRLLHYGAAEGLTNDFTRSVAQSADATLWVATTGGGLYRGGEQGFERFAPNEICRFYAHAESVLATGDDTLWWGTGAALLCWKSGSFSCYTNAPWIMNGTITALCDDRKGGLWIGTSAGILAHEQDSELTLFPGRPVRGAVTALAQGGAGELWVGSRSGDLKRIRWLDKTMVAMTNGLLSRAILTLHLDQEQTLWIGTAGGGLSRQRDGQTATFTSQQGLEANTVAQIVEDDLGCLWLGSNRGIIRVRKSELEDLAAGRTSFLHPRVYGLNDGMPTEECSSGSCPAGLKTRSGLICFPTVKGLVMVDPHQPESTVPPQVRLEEVLVNAKAVSYGIPQSEDSRPFEKVPQLTIPPGSRDLELHYTGIDFSSPEKLSFRYRLDGLQKDWVEAGRRRTAYYHHVPPGQYVFSVMACNADGVWSAQETSLAITLRPYFWETTWFLAVGVVAVLGLLAGSIRLVERRRYKRRLELMELQQAIQRERLRISQDMHDDLGGILTQVSQISDLGQSGADGSAARGQFERIGTHTRAAVQALDEIVWATNPKNDNLPRFAEYVCRFADEFFDGTSVRCWQEVPTNLPQAPLRSELRHNVFLAIKEAFNNVLKHSRAREVWLRLALADGGVFISIDDNGAGFAKDRPAPSGNGLQNMQARLAECGGRTEVQSAPAQGTRIRLWFPLPPSQDVSP